MSIDIQPNLIWIIPALITVTLGIITIMGFFGGNKMPVEGKVSLITFITFITSSQENPITNCSMRRSN
jgi:hypothetical protein